MVALVILVRERFRRLILGLVNAAQRYRLYWPKSGTDWACRHSFYCHVPPLLSKVHSDSSSIVGLIFFIAVITERK